MAGQTGINPLLAFLPPAEQQTYAQLAQRQAIGQALLQQGLQPMDGGQNAVGGVAYHVSPLNGVSKLLNTYLGNKLSMDAAGQQAQLMSQMYGNAFGTNQPQPQAAPSASADPSQTPDAGGIAGGGSGPGVQSSPVANPFQPSAAQIGQQLTRGAQSPRGPLTIPGTTPQQSMMLMSMAPGAYDRAMGAAITPTDATRMALAAGVDPAAANAGALFHANYVQPIQIGANQTVMDPHTGAISTTPSAAAAGSQNILGADGKWYTVPVAGGTQAISAAAAAQAGGEGSQLPYAGVDAQGNPLPVTNRTAAATQNANQPPPIPTLPGLQPVAATTGASGVPLPSGPVPGDGKMYGAPPLAATATAEAQARGQIDTMQKSYQNLQTVRSGAPAALQDVDNMAKLAQGASPATIGPAVAKFAGLFSANAAEYEKSRDNLVTNLGSQLGINSDAARDLVYGSIPSYGAPRQAVQNGLQTLRGQIQTRLLKSDFLSNAYSAGDAKSYNQQENAFDQHITPAAANQISVLNAMPTGAAKAEALKALKGNSAFEWAAQNGVLR